MRGPMTKHLDVINMMKNAKDTASNRFWPFGVEHPGRKKKRIWSKGVESSAAKMLNKVKKPRKKKGNTVIAPK